MKQSTLNATADDSLEVEEIHGEEPPPNNDLPRKFWLLQKEYFGYNSEELGAAFIMLHLSNKIDFSQVKKVESVRRAIQQNRQTRKSVLSVINYSQKIKANDVIVSFNSATDTVLIGIVKSRYIHSYLFGESKKNRQYHLLRTNWRVKRKFELPPELLGRHFVSALDAAQWNLIQTLLLATYPGDTALQKNLQLPEEEPLQSQEDEDLLIPIDFIASQKAAERTRNIIFYGPPGTGKTWMVENFSTYLLLQKNASNRDANSYWESIASRTVAADDASQNIEMDAASPDALSNNSDSSVEDTIRREVRGPLNSSLRRAMVWAIQPLHDRSHEHWAKFFSNPQPEDWDSAPQVFLEEAQSGDFILVNYKEDDEDLLGIAAVETDSEQVAVDGIRLFKIGPISLLPNWESRLNNFQVVNSYGGAKMYRLSEDQT